YIEKEAELEALLLEGNFDRFAIRDRNGRQFSLTDARWQRFGKLLKQYEGWSSALRREYGSEAVGFVEESGMLDERVADTAALLTFADRTEVNGHPFTTSVVSQDAAEIVVRAIETKTGLARTHHLHRELLDAPEYR